MRVSPKLTVKMTLATFTLLLPAVWAAPRTIGIATASGHFTVEGSRIWGNSTLFDGVRVETDRASSELALNNGVRVHLGAGSVARIYADRLMLERGVSQVTSPASQKVKFAVSVQGFEVSDPGGRFQVGKAAEVFVASILGTARVTGARGGIVANIPPGANRSFAMQQTATRTGCLLWKNNGFLLAVDDSPEVLQVNGSDLAANVGNHVELTGTLTGAQASIAPATVVMSVTSISPVARGGCLTTASAISAQVTVPQGAAPSAANAAATPGANPAGGAAPTQPATTASTGLSTGAKVGIIAGVGGGAAVGIIAATGGKKSTSQ